MRTSRRTFAAALAGAATIALVATGCATGGDTPAEGPITLTLATFNDFGYTDELLQEYMDEHPDVTIVHNKAATSNDARANYFQKLGKQGLADVEAVEIDWFTEAMQYSDLLAPVADDLKGRWLDWKEASATDAAGNLIAYGTDIGPQGICYRSDLFAAAGLPTDRDEVAALFDGDWDNFFGVGADYIAATGKPFIDSANSVLQGIVNQIELTYEGEDGSIIATDNADVEGRVRRGRREGDPDRCLLGPVERRLVRLAVQRRVRCHALPGLDARSHLRQRTRRHRLGHR